MHVRVPILPASGSNRLKKLKEKGMSGGNANRLRMRIVAGNVHSTPLAEMAEPNPFATNAVVLIAGGATCLVSSSLALRGLCGRCGQAFWDSFSLFFCLSC